MKASSEEHFLLFAIATTAYQHHQSSSQRIRTKSERLLHFHLQVIIFDVSLRFVFGFPKKFPFSFFCICISLTPFIYVDADEVNSLFCWLARWLVMLCTSVYACLSVCVCVCGYSPEKSALLYSKYSSILHYILWSCMLLVFLLLLFYRLYTNEHLYIRCMYVCRVCRNIFPLCCVFVFSIVVVVGYYYCILDTCKLWVLENCSQWF